VLPDGQLGEDQLAFLHAVAEDDGATLAATAAGLDAGARWPLLLRTGLGRVAVAPLGPALDPARAAEFRGIAPFLWRLRADSAERALAGSACDFAALGKLDAETREATLQNPYAYTNTRRNGQKTEDRPSFREVPLPLTSTFTNLLVPAQVSIIPFGMVFLVFLAFVLAVGPGDWFVLGALRARRFTWIVFPLVAVAFTVLMVRLSRHYLGAADHRDRLTVVDCGRRGEVLRANALELVFTGERSDVESRLSESLWSDCGRGETDEYRYNREPVGERRDAPPEYEGSLPGTYRVSQGIGQWDPRLRRELSLDAPADLPLRLDRDLSYDQRQAYAEELGRLHDQDGPFYVGCFRAGSREDLHGNINALSVRNTETMNWRYGGQTRDWLSWLCSHPACGWFTLVAQVSPCGGATWEDWSVHDPEDRHEWLLVAAQRHGDALWVVRRTYRDDQEKAR
jgi:hypothetical protein